MAEIIYKSEQIDELKWNKYVKNCTEKYITFTDDFKLKCLDLDNQWIYWKDIFEKYWFPEHILNSKIPWESIRRWRFKYKKWKLVWNTKWRKKKERFDKSKMTKDEYIEYLETENTVIKELKKMLDWNYP